jgi:hypothetical protein
LFKIHRRLQKQHREFLCTFHPAFPSNILHNQKSRSKPGD